MVVSRHVSLCETMEKLTDDSDGGATIAGRRHRTEWDQGSSSSSNRFKRHQKAKRKKRMARGRKRQKDIISSLCESEY